MGGVPTEHTKGKGLGMYKTVPDACVCKSKPAEETDPAKQEDPNQSDAGLDSAGERAFGPASMGELTAACDPDEAAKITCSNYCDKDNVEKCKSMGGVPTEHTEGKGLGMMKDVPDACVCKSKPAEETDPTKQEDPNQSDAMGELTAACDPDQAATITCSNYCDKVKIEMCKSVGGVPTEHTEGKGLGMMKDVPDACVCPAKQEEPNQSDAYGELTAAITKTFDKKLLPNARADNWVMGEFFDDMAFCDSRYKLSNWKQSTDDQCRERGYLGEHKCNEELLYESELPNTWLTNNLIDPASLPVWIDFTDPTLCNQIEYKKANSEE